MDKNKHYIFRTLDHSPRILYWPIDEFVLMITPIFFGIAFGCFFLMLGAFIKVPYARLKKALSHRSLIHYVYWHFPTSYLQNLGLIRNLPATCFREYLL